LVALFVGIDWTKDGNFTGPQEDVSTRAKGGKAGRISLQYGRDQTSPVSSVISGAGSLVLGNEDRALSPRNAASPLYGKVKPARPVLIQRTIGATTYTLFQGHTNDTPLDPDLNAKTVRASLLDKLSDFKKQTVSTDLYAGIRTGTAIGLVLDAVGWAGGRDLDPGATVMPWWWLANTDGLTALQDLVASEGPSALVTIGSSGEIVFRDRHHRLLKSRSLTSQSTWRGIGAEPVMSEMAYTEPWANIINSPTVAVSVRQPSGQQVVWSSTGTIELTDGETKLVVVSASDPFMNAVTPDATDMTVASGVVTAALNRTSGSAVTILLTASGGPAKVTSLQLRANPVPTVNQVQISAADSASVADYGPRGYGTQMPWAGPYDVQAILDTLVAQRAQPLPVLTVRFQIGGAITTRAAALLALNLSDRVTVIEAETGLSTDFFIDSIAHDLAGEEDHSITFGLEAAPVIPANLLRFDVAGRGFNDGVFGAGLDDPATIFVFDAASGHRFDEGFFAT
jgi:hypothetical protein